MSGYEIAAGRLLAAAAALRLVMWATGERWSAPRADWPKFIVFGLITALHFLFYIVSLSYTTIAHSLAIIYTAPIFVAIFSAFFLGETITRRKWGGILLAVTGVAILAGFQPQFSRQMLVGDLLALGSAIMFGLYSVAGRSQRNRYSLFTYAITVYACAGLWSLIPAILFFTPGGYSTRAVLSVVMAGLLPLAVGHTLYNAALRRTSAMSVNLIATQEITGGILMGMLFLGEMPGVNDIVGVVVALLGIALVLL